METKNLETRVGCATVAVLRDMANGYLLRMMPHERQTPEGLRYMCLVNQYDQYLRNYNV